LKSARRSKPETPATWRNLTVGMNSQPLPDPLQESIWTFGRTQIQSYEDSVGAEGIEKED